ncbi:MAG: protein kinase [Deltaproteobacteria bacterium]|nr:protein kinase [Deltaproteobacteria bacterium]
MSAKPTAEMVANAETIDQRYQVQKVLGRGGVAIVYQVIDTTTDQTVALKQLVSKDDNNKQKKITDLFEYEFQTLVQLAHPGVVKVYNYGTSNTSPYYTMELLDGGDLNQIAPLDWKQACALLIDVCSALGLIHSHRQVHRDLSPRNIRRTRYGKAKLMDFGAMAPMGPSRAVIGTPAFTAPEVVGYQPLDARTDIYSLGATFYYLLTGGAAYPAKDFKQLSEFWQWTPPAPSERVEGIPEELDNLVMSMIQLDPMARPVNVIEVMEKLSAVAGIDIDERLVVSKSYLSTPNLVGREKQLARIEQAIEQIHKSRGATIVVEGESGQGRSRLLDALVLKGKLSGAAIVKIAAAECRAGAWSGLRSLACQLFEALPELAVESIRPHLSLLIQVFPEIRSRINSIGLCLVDDLKPGVNAISCESQGAAENRSAAVRHERYSSGPPRLRTFNDILPQSPDSAHRLRRRIHEAMRDWLLEIGSKQSVIIALDDIHQIDEPSAAFIALFSQHLRGSKLLLAVSVENDAEAKSISAIALLKNTGKRMRLRALSLEQTESLCSAMFGDTANLRLVANRLYSISRGNPRVIMLLAQHLLDRGLIHYQSGSWSLPNNINESDLPNSLSDVLRARVNALSREAFDLARTMALRPNHGFSFRECQLLTEHLNATSLARNLSDLAACEILASDGELYGFSHQGWIPVLTASLDEASRRYSHLRLAEVFERRRTEPFRTAQHYLEAGQEEQALDILISFSQESRALTGKDPGLYPTLLESLPPGWLHTMQRAIELAKAKGRPQKEIYILLSRLSGLVAIVGTEDTAHLIELLDQQYRDAALEFYQRLGDSVPHEERLTRAFMLAQERYDASPDGERVLAPADAVRALAATLIEAVGIAHITDSLSLLRQLPSIKPLIELSPALWIVDRLVWGHGKGMMGCVERLYSEDLAIIERLDRADKANLEGAHHQYLRYGVTHALGIVEAMMGLEKALARASEIETSPLLQVNAWRIRKIYHLWQASAQEADGCQKQAELLQIQNSPSRYYEGTHLHPELRAYSLSDDLLGVKRVINDIKALSERFSSYVPLLHFAQGEYHRIRGDFPRALDELQKALELGPLGEYQNSVFAACAYLRTLLLMKREEQAQADGEAFLEAARKADLGYLCNYLIMPLAIAESRLGKHEKAVEYSQAVISSFKAMGATGLNLGLAYETRASVAISANDVTGYEQNAECCAEHFKVGRNPVLTARYQKLRQKFRRAQMAIYDEPTLFTQNETEYNVSSTLMNETRGMVQSCADARGRAECLLDILVEKCSCLGGLLYVVRNKTPVLLAQNGRFSLTTEIEKTVRDRLSNELACTTCDSSATGESESAGQFSYDDGTAETARYRSLTIGHYTLGGFIVTGVAVLFSHPDSQYKYPGDIVTVVSKVLLESGDSVPA